ncbi:MAG: ATP-binding cassette domain-containing protein, partial [Candidatus Bathyarchaeia archaeon]
MTSHSKMRRPTQPQGPEGRETVLELRGITKSFPGVKANDDVYFTLRSGEVHALLGENGAGKTTLMNIIYGLYQPDKGEILINGKRVNIRSPQDAIALGIGMVHQHFMLIPTLTVMENVILGLRSQKSFLTDKSAIRKRILEISEKYGLAVNPDAKVGQLSVGEKQRVEIVKALYRGAKILILDEPTAVLTPPEIEEIMKIIRLMADQGMAVIPFITHKLPEVMAVSDRVTVLRQGKVVSTIDTKATNEKDLA